MTQEPKTITLGTNIWTINPLSVKQLEEISKIIMNYEYDSVNAAIRIISIGLNHEYTAKDLESVQTTITEVYNAMNTILRLGEFIPDESSKQSDYGLVGEFVQYTANTISTSPFSYKYPTRELSANTGVTILSSSDDYCIVTTTINSEYIPIPNTDPLSKTNYVYDSINNK